MIWETKKISGTLVDRQTDKVLAEARRAWPDSMRRRNIGANLSAARERYVTEIETLVGVAKNVAMPAARLLMLSSFEAAMRAGYGLAGLPGRPVTEKEVLAIGRMADFELGRFSKFHADVASEAKRHRARLYGGAVNAAFWRGWVASLPAAAKIRWELGVAEHCADCPRLAKNGPYDKPGQGRNPLPTVPTNGDTQCLGNCLCHLRAVGSDFISQLVASPFIEVLAIAGHAIGINSDAERSASSLYDGMMSAYAWELRMAVVAPTGGHINRAADLRRQIVAMASNLNQTIRFAATNDEIQAPATDALVSGLRAVPEDSIDDNLIELVATVLYTDTIKRGKIIAVGKKRVELEGQGWVPIGRAHGTILFVDAS